MLTHRFSCSPAFACFRFRFRSLSLLLPLPLPSVFFPDQPLFVYNIVTQGLPSGCHSRGIQPPRAHPKRRCEKPSEESSQGIFSVDEGGRGRRKCGGRRRRVTVISITVGKRPCAASCGEWRNTQVAGRWEPRGVSGRVARILFFMAWVVRCVFCRCISKSVR